MLYFVITFKVKLYNVFFYVDDLKNCEVQTYVMFQQYV